MQGPGVPEDGQSVPCKQCGESFRIVDLIIDIRGITHAGCRMEALRPDAFLQTDFIMVYDAEEQDGPPSKN